MKAYERSMYILTLILRTDLDLIEICGKRDVWFVYNKIPCSGAFCGNTKREKRREEKAAYMCLHIASWLGDYDLTNTPLPSRWIKREPVVYTPLNRSCVSLLDSLSRATHTSVKLKETGNSLVGRRHKRPPHGPTSLIKMEKQRRVFRYCSSVQLLPCHLWRKPGNQ